MSDRNHLSSIIKEIGTATITEIDPNLALNILLKDIQIIYGIKISKEYIFDVSSTEKWLNVVSKLEKKFENIHVIGNNSFDLPIVLLNSDTSSEYFVFTGIRIETEKIAGFLGERNIKAD